MFCWDVLVQLVWRNQFCQSSSPHPHPLAKVYDSKQDFLYATKSICDFSFFFWSELRKFSIWAFQFLAHIFSWAPLVVWCKLCLAEGHLAKGKNGPDIYPYSLTWLFVCAQKRCLFQICKRCCKTRLGSAVFLSVLSVFSSRPFSIPSPFISLLSS